METVVGVEGNDEAKFEDSDVAKTSSAPASPKQIADPVVYKLVRVDGDGRLVPATDDEVMEVEDLLEDDKSEVHFVAETGQTVECTNNDGLPLGRTQLNGSEGLSQSETPRVNEENSDVQPDASIDLGISNARVEENVTSLAVSLKDNHIDQSGSVGECSNPPGAPVESMSSKSSPCTTSKPDFSKLKGQICLDKLSVKELHETFRATFGRETSVKDKQWLKRRIAMALTNSCDVSSTTFLIKDSRVIRIRKEETAKSVDHTLGKEPVVESINETCGGSPIGHNNQIENPQNSSDKKLGNPCLEYNCSSEDLQTEHRAAKRVRKPTRRYIEELSEVESRESGGKLISSVKNSGHGQSSPRTCVTHLQNVRSDGRPLVTRQDSLGGSGVQIPYVSRIRRGRPRENFMALMKLQPSGVGMTAKLVKKAFGVRGPRSDNERGNQVFKAKLAPGWIQQQHFTEQEKEKQCLQRKMDELAKDVDLQHMDSSGDNSDDNIVTVPTAKGGMRRKHHRPWTLREVVKLVDGVARYGAGRWSEIKRLAFASYSYRTSVDLKDKWRNLLKASFAQLPAEKAIQNSRKHASMPIPAPILLRVRELAEMQAQVLPNGTSSKFVGHCGMSVHETRSGYL